MNRPSYRFKLLFRLPQYGLVGESPADFVVFERNGVSVRLRSSGKLEGLTGLEEPRSADLVPYTLEGSGFYTRDDAKAAGKRWKGALLTWAASRRVPLDFRLGTSSEPQTERMDEFHLNVLVKVLPNLKTRVEEFTGPITSYFDLGQVNDKAMLALELYTASFLDSSQGSQFVTRVTAIEALIEQPNSSSEMVAMVAELKKVANPMPLKDWERQQINTAFENLRTQSITRSGVALVERLLPDYFYDAVSAPKLFKKLYSTRSKIVHTGRHPGQKEDFEVLCHQCMNLVGDVLIAYVRDTRPTQPDSEDYA